MPYSKKNIFPDLVINCEPPKDVEAYVHRSGRTGRAGRPGTAVTFFKAQDEYLIQNIQRRTKVQFQVVGPPQPVDIIAATTQDALYHVESVNPTILPLFKETAQTLIEKKGSVEALSAALAYIAGYANGIKARSLLTGSEGNITLIFRFRYPIKHVSYLRNILSKTVPELTADDVKIMRLTKDGLGIAVDLASDKVEIIPGGGLRLAGRQWEDTLNTNLEVCKELPEFSERGGGNFGNGGNWSGVTKVNRYGNSYRGGSRTNNYGNNNRGSRGGRGGYSRGGNYRSY